MVRLRCKFLVSDVNLPLLVKSLHENGVITEFDPDEVEDGILHQNTEGVTVYLDDGVLTIREWDTGTALVYYVVFDAERDSDPNGNLSPQVHNLPTLDNPEDPSKNFVPGTPYEWGYEEN